MSMGWTSPAPTTQGFGVGQVLGYVGGAVLQRALGGTTSTATNLGTGTPSAIPYRAGYGNGTRRRRRRRLLTCSDKADIAYLVGQLGQGQLGKAAISALLSRRCG